MGQPVSIFIQGQPAQIRRKAGVRSVILIIDRQGHQRPPTLLFPGPGFHQALGYSLVPFPVVIQHGQIQIIGNRMLVIRVFPGQFVSLLFPKLPVPIAFVKSLQSPGDRVQGGDHPMQLYIRAVGLSKGFVAHSRSPKGHNGDLLFSDSLPGQKFSIQGGTGAAQAVPGQQQFPVGVLLQKRRHVIGLSVPIQVHSRCQGRFGIA